MDILYVARYTYHASLRMEHGTYIGCWPGHVVFRCLLCGVCAVVRCVTDTMQLIMNVCVCVAVMFTRFEQYYVYCFCCAILSRIQRRQLMDLFTESTDDLCFITLCFQHLNSRGE